MNGKLTRNTGELYWSIFGLKEDHSDGLSYNGDMDRKEDADYEREEVDK